MTVCLSFLFFSSGPSIYLSLVSVKGKDSSLPQMGGSARSFVLESPNEGFIQQMANGCRGSKREGEASKGFADRDLCLVSVCLFIRFLTCSVASKKRRKMVCLIPPFSFFVPLTCTLCLPFCSVPPSLGLRLSVRDSGSSSPIHRQKREKDSPLSFLQSCPFNCLRLAVFHCCGPLPTLLRDTVFGLLLKSYLNKRIVFVLSFLVASPPAICRSS
mmetsp:Transcript_23151/g.45564  ORF Transcript_23151/g.45564 Transcript_23151/m.45564 type:complete len:215 (-) Transcript_23151:396-1040(-)